MKTRLGIVAGSAVALALSAMSAAVAMDLPANDYPTVSRSDYVFACMQVNGQTREMLEKCSCSIDQIAALLPFAEYEEAETIMSVQLRGGENVAAMHYAPMQEKIKRLKLAQVEAELRCF
ncbi:MAG: hypothetical protein ACRCS9_11620 [Hyphomicrobium sp.]